MTLTLRAVSLNDQPLTQPITAHFDANGGSIGRADHNVMALPDPERHISRQQAQISMASGSYRIKNVGSANPIIVRGQALGQGESAPLAHRDQVRIGGYLLEVIEDREDEAAAHTILRGRAALDARAAADAAAPGGPATPRGQPGGLPGGGVPGSAAGGPSGGAAGGLSAAEPGGRSGPRSGGFASGLSAELGAPLSSSNPFADLLGPSTPARAAEPLAPSPAPRAAPPTPTPARAVPPPPAPAWAAPPPPSAAWDAPPAPAPARAAQQTPAPARAVAPMPMPARTPPAAPAAPAARDANPFADLLPPPAGVPSSSAAFASPAPAVARLPDDFDPFAPPPPAPAPAARFGPLSNAPSAAPARAPRGEFDDLIPAANPGSIDDLFDLPSAARGDPLAAFMADASPAVPHGGARADRVSTDPLAMFADELAPAPPGGPALPDHTPALRSAFTPPGLALPRDEAAPSPAPRPPAAPPAWAAPEASADSAALWQAFCDGAGIRVDSQPALGPELMRVIGALLRATVDGSLQLMAVRAATKHEMRAQVTVIQPRNNNPLKFSPDAQSALEQLLQPPLRGFLDGPAAMTDAMHDLVGHSIGTMAGMRAALEGVLDRFSPQALEAKLSNKTMLDTLLPMNRKAKLWELYLQHAQGIRGEAQDDFETLFGKAFLAAYEQQLDRLQTAAPTT